MEINPYVFSAIGFLSVAFQFFIHMNTARRLLPAVRKSHELLPNQRIKLIADAGLETQRIKYERLFIFVLVYLPVMFLLTLEEDSIWPGFVFMLVCCAQIFIIWVANNHAKIVKLQLDKFTPSELEAYIAYIQKRRS